jgi:ABC-type dipeptide/oligopeptide/nickel transport system permease component
VPLWLNLAFSFADFFAYLKALFTKRTLGFSDFDYPQTVQHFILASFPHSFCNFLLILAVSFCTLGVFLFFLTSKIEMKSNFSELSRFLCMDKRKIAKQAKLAALSKQVLFWSFFAPAIFVALLFFEAKFEILGLGSTIKIAFERNDFSLFYGSLCCTIMFILAVNIFFLMLKNILPHK